MSIAFVCPSCGREFNLPDNLVGRKARCKCGVVNVVTAQPQEDAAIGFRDDEADVRPTPVPSRRSDQRGGGGVSTRGDAPLDEADLVPDDALIEVHDADSPGIPLVATGGRDDYSAAPLAPAAQYRPTAVRQSLRPLSITPTRRANAEGGWKSGPLGTIVGVVFTVLVLVGIAARVYRLDRMLDGKSGPITANQFGFGNSSASQSARRPSSSGIGPFASGGAAPAPATDAASRRQGTAAVRHAIDAVVFFTAVAPY